MDQKSNLEKNLEIIEAEYKKEILVNKLPKEFGNCFRFLRKKSGMTQEALTEAIGIKTPGTISRWEKVVTRPPLTIQQLVACCIAFKLEFEISLALIERSGMSFLKNNEFDQLLKIFLKKFNNKTLEELNVILYSKNFNRFDI